MSTFKVDLQGREISTHKISAIGSHLLVTIRSVLYMWSVWTSNVTGRQRGPKQKRHHYNACAIYRYCSSVGPVLFSSSSVVSCAFSAVCAYSLFGHYPHHLGYPCAKFRFCHALHCWADPAEKNCILNHSLTQSLTQLIWFPGNRSFRFGITDTHRDITTAKAFPRFIKVSQFFFECDKCPHWVHGDNVPKSSSQVIQAHDVAPISISLAISRTQAYTVRPWLVHCTVSPSFQWYSLHLLTEGWPGWVDTNGHIMMWK